MSCEFAELLAGQFNLLPEEKRLLLKTTRELTRAERRIFFQTMKPREKEFKNYLRLKLAAEEEARWVEITGRSLLTKGGEPDLVDSLVMDVVGRLKVYRYLREKAEEEGIRLKPLTNFGGLTMVLFIVMIVTALILYLSSR
ncbi:MAG: hypothetical protein AB1523_06195 [Bacillota bacterium]